MSQVIEKQYPTDEFSLDHFSGVTFTQSSSATLDFSVEPVAGWFLQPGMLRKVRFTCQISCIMYLCVFILCRLQKKT